MSGPRTRRSILVFSVVFVLLALFLFWFTFREPGAQSSAKRFGRTFHSAISDAELMAWAKQVSSAGSSQSQGQVEIPRGTWPREIAALLERNAWATATLYLDHKSVPTGIAFRQGIVGVVIPLNGCIPDANYFSIHMIEPNCPYYAFSIYK